MFCGSVVAVTAGVAAGVFARYSCRHSWNLRLRLTESDNHRRTGRVFFFRCTHMVKDDLNYPVLWVRVKGQG